MISTTDTAVNYDGAALLELEVEGVDYRVDAGKQNTTLCISTRTPGTWDWALLGEARWDGSNLRTRALERRILAPLSAALAQAIEQLD